MMLGVSRHDITANNHGRGVEGMLVLTELRLMFLPDIGGAGSATASFLEFNTVQVRLHETNLNFPTTNLFRLCVFVSCPVFFFVCVCVCGLGWGSGKGFKICVCVSCLC